MIQRIEFTNQPPTVADCPEMALRLLARELVEATRKHKQQQKKEKNYVKNNTPSDLQKGGDMLTPLAEPKSREKI